jgi:hypothetical protein
MVRIGRNVDFNVTFETFTNGYLKWLPTRPAQAEPEPYVAKISTGNAKPVNVDLYGEGADLLSLQAYVEEREVLFIINGPAVNPEPVPEVEPPPDPDQVAADIITRASFNTQMTVETDAFWAAVEADFLINGGNPAFFRRITDLKWLRQRA